MVKGGYRAGLGVHKEIAKFRSQISTEVQPQFTKSVTIYKNDIVGKFKRLTSKEMDKNGKQIIRTLNCDVERLLTNIGKCVSTCSGMNKVVNRRIQVS